MLGNKRGWNMLSGERRRLETSSKALAKTGSTVAARIPMRSLTRSLRPDAKSTICM